MIDNNYDDQKDVDDIGEDLESLDVINSNPTPLVQINNASRIFTIEKQEIIALDDVTLEVLDGEFIVLLGPSGAGKSTLMNVIGGLDSLTSGTALVDNQDILSLEDSEQANYRREMIGFIFQTFNLESRLTARENVELPLLFANTSPKKRQESALTSLKLVGLSDRVNHKPSELSGGQQQRVAIARAIVNGPKILLADEPTGNLDSNSAKEIMQILEMLNSEYGITIIMVTHNEVYAKYAERVFYMNDGKIVKEKKGGKV